MQASAAVAQSEVKELQQAVNAGAGIMQVSGVHSDGRIESIDSSHPDWTPDLVERRLRTDVVPFDPDLITVYSGD